VTKQPESLCEHIRRISAHNWYVSGYIHSTCWSFYTNLLKEDIDYVSCSVYEYGEWKYNEKSVPAICVCVCVYTHTHTNTHTHRYTYMHTYIHTQTRARTHM